MTAAPDAVGIHAKLQNWGRWVRTRPVQGHCASIEHRYRSKLRPDETPTGWGDWLTASPMPPMPPIDELSALAVERVMRHVPKGHRAALKLHYVLRMPYKLACKRLHLGYDRWERFVYDAQLMVANRLHQQEKKSICLQTIRLPVQTETLAPVGAECV